MNQKRYHMLCWKHIGTESNQPFEPSHITIPNILSNTKPTVAKMIACPVSCHMEETAATSMIHKFAIHKPINPCTLCWGVTAPLNPTQKLSSNRLICTIDHMKSPKTGIDDIKVSKDVHLRRFSTYSIDLST